MIFEGIYSRFKPGISPATDNKEDDLWFIFYRSKLLIRLEGDDIDMLCYDDIGSLDLNIKHSNYIGTLDGRNCYCGELLQDIQNIKGMEFKELRALISVLDRDTSALIGRAFQIVEWDRTNQYCGRCGSRVVAKQDERAKLCPECGYLSYPRISPAIIVAVVKDDSILLAHNSNFKSGVYSIIAGFVEPGETFEECVAREVKEEVGIGIKNIKYFGSQPWPFPHSVMVGFTAEYACGEIKPDGVEISDAAWFNKKNLPKIPSGGSIARRLIDWFVDNHNR